MVVKQELTIWALVLLYEHMIVILSFLLNQLKIPRESCLDCN